MSLTLNVLLILKLFQKKDSTNDIVIYITDTGLVFCFLLQVPGTCNI